MKGSHQSSKHSKPERRGTIFRRIGIAVFASLLAIAVLQPEFRTSWLSQYTYASLSSNPQVVATNLLNSWALDSGIGGELSREALTNEFFESAPAAASPVSAALSKRVAEYHIDVALHEKTNTLTATQTVIWTNPGEKTVSELYWHLYPNAFLSGDSTFMQESGGKLRQDHATANAAGSLQLHELQTDDGESLLPRLQYVQPDDGNEHDRTLARLRLPKPVQSGQSVTLKLQYSVQLPEVFARMGYSGPFVMAGQWFPKVAVYEGKGVRGRAQEGWSVHQYHGNSEFYSDFAVYYVKIQVPEAYRVAATGLQAGEPQIKKGMAQYTFYAEDVHDFAWSASPNFVYAEDSLSSSTIPGVRIRLYLDPTHAALEDRYMHAAKSALSKLSDWYGTYPYSTLSIVVPPAGASGAGGMEYPSLVTGLAADDAAPGYELERTVIHEIAHQYWYGMVASNEFEEAWLDEGLTSYTEDKIMQDVYGLSSNHQLEASYMTHPAPLKQNAWDYSSHQHYAENVYIRAKLVLIGLEKKLGEENMRGALRTYFQHYRFKHPSTTDFQRVLERKTKKSLQEYFDSFVYGAQMADYAINRIEIKQPQAKESSDSSVKDNLYESRVLLKRLGSYNGPVPLLLQFTDGSRRIWMWEAKEEAEWHTETHTTPIAFAVLDPQQQNVLDNKRFNNFLQAEPSKDQRISFNLRAIKLVEGLRQLLAW